MYENLERIGEERGKEVRYKRDIQTENVIRRTVEKAEAQGMQVNVQKTAMISVSDAMSFKPVIFMIDSQGVRLESKEDTIKILGFHFGQKPSVEYQVNEIIRKVRRRYWVLRHLKKYGMTEQELVAVYCSLLRSVIEFTSTVYGPMLSSEQVDALKKLQTQSLKIIFGFNRSAREVRELAGLETLSGRRVVAIEKFDVKCYEGKFSHRFPENPSTRSTRGKKRFREDYARCDRRTPQSFTCKEL
jgi:hypothetical protein